jgi:hypothetical protein
MALVHVIKNGPKIDARHVGTTGSHCDESDTLWLDGKTQSVLTNHLHRGQLFRNSRLPHSAGEYATATAVSPGVAASLSLPSGRADSPAR